MRLYKKLLLVFGALALLAGCNQQAMIEKFAPKEESAIAQRALSELIAKNFGWLDSQLDPSLKRPES